MMQEIVSSDHVGSRPAGNVFTLGKLHCSDGWVVATGTLGTGATASDAPQGAPLQSCTRTIALLPIAGAAGVLTLG